MQDASGPFTVERRDLVRVGRDWEPIESSWECQNPVGSLGDAQIVARTLALRADGDGEYRVIDADRAVLATFRVTKRLEVRRPETGAPDRLEQEDLPPGLEVPLLSDALEQSSHRL
jgi:hypothetical protein